MPARAKVDLLPAPVREALNRELIGRGFSGYVEMSAWLAERGFSIGKSALAEHGSRLARRIEATRLATEQAEALVSAAPDETGAVADASLRIVQERIFDLLLAAEEQDLQTLSKAAKGLAEAARASTAVRAERRRALAEAAAIVRDEGRARGMSPDLLDAIDARLMPK